MPRDPGNSFFDLFGLPQKFAIDMAQLDQNYRKLQGEIHPDRFAAAPAAERLQSLQWATQANEAYRTLKDPIARAGYLLHLNGVETQDDSNTAMSSQFLMRQMEWREAIEEAQSAHDIDALETIMRDLRHEIGTLQADTESALDHLGNYLHAAETVRKLRFLDKVRDEIERAITSLE